MRLLVFLHGTVLMHAGGVDVTRAERVAQVRAKHPTVREYAAYVPVGGAVAKLRRWQDAGAVVGYLSSHRNPDDGPGCTRATHSWLSGWPGVGPPPGRKLR